MDAKLKRKWVKALLSGWYKQGRNELLSDDGNHYCCLGVLGKCAGLGERPLMTNAILDNDAWIPGAPDFEIQGELAHLNDQGVPFDMIAGLIDEAL